VLERVAGQVVLLLAGTVAVAARPALLPGPARVGVLAAAVGLLTALALRSRWRPALHPAVLALSATTGAGHPALFVVALGRQA